MVYGRSPTAVTVRTVITRDEYAEDGDLDGDDDFVFLFLRLLIVVDT